MSETRVTSSVGRRGFTLVELLVVTAIFMIVLVALGALFSSGTRAYTVTAERSEAIQDSEAVFQLLRHELALAGYRGTEEDFDRPFTLGGGGQETVIIDREVDGDVVMIRYFEDRFIELGDSGERLVQFYVDDGTLVRRERRGVADFTTELLVDSVSEMRVLDLVGPGRDRISVADVISDPGAAPLRVAGIIVAVEFRDGRSWELMIGLANPQEFDVN